MKTLLVMRHAKSSWKNESLSDHDRPLNKRGESAAPRMGHQLARERLIPDAVLTSTAIRAKTTAKIVKAALSSDAPLHQTDKLYAAPASAYVEEIARRDFPGNTLLIVGHEPSVSDLVLTLTERSEAMPTAAIAVIHLPIEKWSDLAGDTKGELMALWTPRDVE